MSKIDNKTIFSTNLQKLRKARGVSQAKLAEIAGLSQRVISSYENDIASPPLNNIIAIANALSIELGELLNFKKVNNSQNEYLQLDSRTIEKLKVILSLSKKKRHVIYMLADALLLKEQTENIGIKESRT